MNLDRFLAELQADNSKKKNTHKLGESATDAAIAAWQKKHPQFQLPQELVQLLKRHNGIAVFADRTSHGMLQIRPLRQWVQVSKIHYGDDADVGEGEVPLSMLGFGNDDNGDWAPAIDTATGKYRISEATGAGAEAEETFDTLEEFFDWVYQRILLERRQQDQEELERARQAKKSPKKRSAATALQEVRAFAGHLGRIADLAVSPGGERLATVSQDQTMVNQSVPVLERVLRVWDVASGQELPIAFELPDYNEDFPGISRPLASVAWSPDGKRLVVGLVGLSAVVLDAASGRAVHRIDGLNYPGCAGFSGDGQVLLLASSIKFFGDGAIRLLDGRNYEPIRQIQAHRPYTFRALFSPDGRRTYSSGQDKCLKVWDTATGALADEWPRQKYPVIALAISPDQTRVVTGSMSDRNVTIWDSATKTRLFELPGHRSQVGDIAISPDGRRVATTDGSSLVRLWDMATGAELGRYSGHTHEFYCANAGQGSALAFTPDCKFLFSGNSAFDPTVRMLALPD